jgi:predicted component of type VI protein secretion system
MEATERFRDFKLGQVIRTVKSAHELVLLAEEEAALQGMLDRQTEIGKNVEESKVVRV